VADILKDAETSQCPRRIDRTESKLNKAGSQMLFALLINSSRKKDKIEQEIIAIGKA